jgi:lipopolysaccharide export system protein LptA
MQSNNTLSRVDTIKRILALIVFIFVLFYPAVGQKTKTVELRNADKLTGKVINGEQVQELVGNVHFVQPGEGGAPAVKVWCNRAMRWMMQNKIELFGNVRIIREGTILTAPEGVYYVNDRHAQVTKGVRLQRTKSTLTAIYGDYYLEDRRAYFRQHVVVVDTASLLNSDDLLVLEQDSITIASGHVSLRQYENNITVFGDTIINFEKHKYALVPRNPLLLQIDTTSSGRIDTLLVRGERMEAYQDTSEQKFVAIDSVLIAHPSLAAQCGRATYELRNEIIILERKPTAWYDVNQLSGDSMTVTIEQKRLRKVFVKNRAMAISRADSLYPRRYNQLTGRELTMWFRSDKLEMIDVVRNATSLYYVFDDRKPNGANKSSGDRIIIEFLDGAIERIRVIGGVEGVYHAEKSLRGNEPSYNLDGFRWNEMRPKKNNLSIIYERYQ